MATNQHRTRSRGFGVRVPMDGASLVLIVEDDPLIRMGLADICQRAGFEVFEAVDGIEALHELRINPSIQLIVTDIDMPRMDGLQLARTVGEEFRSVRIVLLSGKTYARTHDLPSGVPFFEKPVDEARLLGCLETLRLRGSGGTTVG